MSLSIDIKTVQIKMIQNDIDSYDELAKMAGVHPNTVYRMMAGKPWKNSTLDAIANALDCSPLDIITAEKNKAQAFAPAMG